MEEYCEFTRHLIAFAGQFKKFFKEVHRDGKFNGNFFFLLHLKHCPGRSMSYYSGELAMHKSNITTLVDSLVKKGYLERVVDEKDRRCVNLELTRAGNEYIDKNLRQLEKQICEGLKIYSLQEVSAMDGHIQSIMEIINHHK